MHTQTTRAQAVLPNQSGNLTVLNGQIVVLLGSCYEPANQKIQSGPSRLLCLVRIISIPSLKMQEKNLKKME